MAREAGTRTSRTAAAVAAEKAIAEHRAWWDEFWNRSWIRVSGTPEAEAITRGYTLQRWISACGGRGAYPIKFNGSIFTVDAPPLDPDYRRWGGPYWLQNTRLPYWPMLASGDFDLMRPLFRMYQRSLPLAAERTRVWFGHGGAFLPETMYFWGMYVNENYGWDRDGLAVSELTNHYIRREYTASPELMAMMLDYFAFTEDESFLGEDALADVRRPAGVLGQALPAGRGGPARDVSGPGAGDVSGRGQPDARRGRAPLGARAAAGIAGKPRRRRATRVLDPAAGRRCRRCRVGDENGEKIILPAGKIFGGPGNSENPELYAVFPFRLYGVGKPDLDIAPAYLRKAEVPRRHRLAQDDTQAALLGLADEAAGLVASRAASRDEGSRFPAFWGPNFDWIPDQDHGGNLMMALRDHAAAGRRRQDPRPARLAQGVGRRVQAARARADDRRGRLPIGQVRVAQSDAGEAG